MRRRLSFHLSRLLLERGEAIVASTGLALAAILLFGLGALGWWSLHTQATTLAEARRSQLESSGALMQQTTERLLMAGEISGLRRMVSTVAESLALQSSRVVLLDGHNIAHSDPSSIDLLDVPETWPPGTAAPEAVVHDDGMLTLTFPLSVPGRGQALLEFVGTVRPVLAVHWTAEAGVGLIGAVTLVLFLITYRRLRRRLQAVGAIRDALLALQRGETLDSAMKIAPRLGEEAEAWNTLLDQRSELRQARAVEHAVDSLHTAPHSSARFDQVCDAMWFGLLVVDDRARVIYANGAASVLLQKPPEKLIHAPIEQCLDAAAAELVRAALAQSGSARSAVELTMGRTMTDGVLRLSVRPVRHQGSIQALLVIEDITQQRVADEARNAFVTQATHEIRSPLTNIRLYADTAMTDGDADPTMRGRCLNVIHDESRRLERIVADMLSVSEIEAGVLRLAIDDVRLDSVFRELEADYRAAAKEAKITLHFDLPPKLPVLRGDRDKITLALHNVLGNALKYTGEGGKVTVRVDADGDLLKVDVIDTGIGIDEEDLEHIFEKFQRAKDPRVAAITGSGLGLALVRDIVRMHGGHVTVQSKLDEGSTFRVELPLKVEAAVA